MTQAQENAGARMRKAASDIYYFSTLIQLFGTPEDKEAVLKPLEKTSERITMKAAMIMAKREKEQMEQRQAVK